MKILIFKLKRLKTGGSLVVRMETEDFFNFFKKLPAINQHFVGVFPIVKLPTSMKKRTFLICNLDPSWKGGSHWITFFKTATNECEIFDSLGFRPETVVPYLKFKQKLSLVTSPTVLQSENSKLCGKFCITFCVERLLNPDLELDHLLEEVFSSDLNKNDEIVITFCNKIIYS